MTPIDNPSTREEILLTQKNAFSRWILPRFRLLCAKEWKRKWMMMTKGKAAAIHSSWMTENFSFENGKKEKRVEKSAEKFFSLLSIALFEWLGKFIFESQRRSENVKLVPKLWATLFFLSPTRQSIQFQFLFHWLLLSSNKWTFLPDFDSFRRASGGDFQFVLITCLLLFAQEHDNSFQIGAEAEAMKLTTVLISVLTCSNITSRNHDPRFDEQSQIVVRKCFNAEPLQYLFGFF